MEDEISLLSKYNITPNELMFIRTLLILQDEDDEELFAKYLQVLINGGFRVRDIILCLQEKGIVLQSYKLSKEGSEFDPNAIPLNKNFLKTLYKCSFEMGKELFEEYPQFGSIQGNLVGLRSISKKFDSLEQAYFKYGKSIGWNLEKHNHIIELVKWAKEHEIINYSLQSFIIDQRWLELESLKEGDTTNINYDTIRML